MRRLGLAALLALLVVAQTGPPAVQATHQEGTCVNDDLTLSVDDDGVLNARVYFDLPSRIYGQIRRADYVLSFVTPPYNKHTKRVVTTEPNTYHYRSTKRLRDAEQGTTDVGLSGSVGTKDGTRCKLERITRSIDW
jgi:hypothetical protein